MKPRSKYRRKFIGNQGCGGAVLWAVRVLKHHNNRKFPNKMIVEGTFDINRDAQSFYVDTQKEMEPLYRAREELDTFIQTLDEAFYDVKEHNESA